MTDRTVAPEILTLRRGDSRVSLAPGWGGSVLDWWLGDSPILRPPTEAALAGGDPRDLGCFPLVPFSNRIAGGVFTWAGREVRLPVGLGDPAHAIHGIGWRRPWQVAAAGEAAARLVLDHAPTPGQSGGWPFAFRAEQHFTLTETGLKVVISIENRDRMAAPAGLGLHPYFPRPAGTLLDFVADGVWRNGADRLPAARTAVPAEWDFRGGRVVGRPALDNCFAGWDGTARILWPDRRLGVRIEAGPIFRHLVVYAPDPPEPDLPQMNALLAVEPVSHMNDAANRRDQVPDHGLVALPPGETLAGEIRFLIEQPGAGAG